jgi:hypothetical protein
MGEREGRGRKAEACKAIKRVYFSLFIPINLFLNKSIDKSSILH